MTDEPNPKRTVAKRLHHSEELWAQVRQDYLAGYTGSAVSARYGMSVDAIPNGRWGARHSGTSRSEEPGTQGQTNHHSLAPSFRVRTPCVPE